MTRYWFCSGGRRCGDPAGSMRYRRGTLFYRQCRQIGRANNRTSLRPRSRRPPTALARRSPALPWSQNHAVCPSVPCHRDEACGT